jgi:glycosyltransferase involved in cell wall biosynthesis
LTFVLLTKDEARNLPRALDALPSGSRVLVVDAESSDGTALVARARGVETIVRPWAGFVAARRFAQSAVATPWTFMLDADEVLDRELSEAVRTLAPPEGVDGFTVRRINNFCGRPIRYGAWGDERPLRLFRTRVASLESRPVTGGSAELHERWSVPGRVGELGGTLAHYSYPTLRAYREKFARYTAIEARGLQPSPGRLAVAAARAVVRGPWLLFGRGGWRDGWRGAYIAFASAFYPVAVAWKALRPR